MGDEVQLEEFRVRRANGSAGQSVSRAGGAESPVLGRCLVFPADPAASRALRVQTQVVLATLTPREQRVLRMRFGIGALPRRTLDEISRRFALPPAQILEIELHALRKLRRLDGRKKISGGLRMWPGA